jgi:mannosyltransferase OCH1-like enzyme
MIIKKYDNKKKYTFGCVITAYNRSKITSATIKSINDSFIPNDLLFIVIDDNSTENMKFDLKNDHIIIKKDNNYGVANSLAVGWDLAYAMNIPFLLNLDSDVAVSRNWLCKILSTYHNFTKTEKDQCIITGFNGQNHNVIKKHDDYLIKESIGGINLFFSKDNYPIIRKSLTNNVGLIKNRKEIIKSIPHYGKNPVIHSEYLIDVITKKGLDPQKSANGWDWSLVSICESENIRMICTKPSVVQHTAKGLHNFCNKYEKSIDFRNQSIVPKIIHQTWKSDNIPKHLKQMQKTVINNNKSFNYKLWTDIQIDKFIKKNYPKIWDFYNSYEYIIQKIDFARLLILYHFGGIYIDLDTVCFGSLECVRQYPVTLIKTKKHHLFTDYDYVLNNAFIAAESKNVFIESCINNAMNFDVKKMKPIQGMNMEYSKVLCSAGPLMVTKTHMDYNCKGMINIFDDNFYHGIEKKPNQNCMKLAKDTKKKLENCKMIHVHESSWWKDKNNKTKLPDKNRS